MTPRALPVLSLTQVFVAPTTPHHDPQRAGASPRPSSPGTNFTSPIALSPGISLLRSPQLEVLSSEFPHTPSAPSSHAGPGRPNSVAGSWPSRLHTGHLAPQIPQISVLGPHLRTHIPILWIPGSRFLRTPVHWSHLTGPPEFLPLPHTPLPQKPT